MIEASRKPTLYPRRKVAAVVAGLTMLAIMVPPAAYAQEATVAAFDEAFTGWMRRHGVGSGVIAVARQGRVVHAAGFGMAADAAVPVASLSKAVTAVCVAELIQQGKLDFATPLSTALARTFQRLGGPVDPRLANVTIAQLLTHRAGYQRAGKADPLTSAPLAAYLRQHPASQPAIDAQVTMLLRQTLPLPPGTRYAYSNAPYLLLGAVIEEATGASYETHCQSTVLAKVGAADARLVPQWRVRASYGGWAFTGAQYLAFHEVFAPQGPILSPATRQWLTAPQDKQVSGNVHYGLGTLVRFSVGSYNFWHTGRWVFRYTGASHTHLNADHGTYVARLGERGFSWFAFHMPTVDEKALGELDRWMAAAGGSVRRWP